MSKVLLQAKANLTSTIDNGDGTWSLGLALTENNGVYNSLSVQPGDVLVIATGTFEAGTYTRYIINSATVSSATALTAIVTYDPTNNNTSQPDLNYAYGYDALLTRPTTNYGLLPTPAPGLQVISDDYAEYVSNMNLEIIDTITGGTGGTTDLSAYSTTVEMNSAISTATTGLATETYVGEQITANATDLTNYYTSSQVDNAITSAVTGGTVDLSNYFNKTETNTAIDTKIAAIDLTSYATTTSVNTAISQEIAGLSLATTLDDLTDVQVSGAGHVPTDGQALAWSAAHGHWMPSDVSVDLTGLATETYVGEQIAAIPATDLTGLATETYVGDQIAAIPATDLTGLATETYVGEQIAAIPATDLTGLATETYVTSQGYISSETNTVLSHNAATKTLSYTDETGSTTDIDLTSYIDDTNLARLTSGTIDPVTGIATFTRDDDSTFTVDFSTLISTNADTLDNLSSSQFVRSDQIDVLDGASYTVNGELNINNKILGKNLSYRGVAKDSRNELSSMILQGFSEGKMAYSPNFINDLGYGITTNRITAVVSTGTSEFTDAQKKSMFDATQSYANIPNADFANDAEVVVQIDLDPSGYLQYTTEVGVQFKSAASGFGPSYGKLEVFKQDDSSWHIIAEELDMTTSDMLFGEAGANATGISSIRITMKKDTVLYTTPVRITTVWAVDANSKLGETLFVSKGEFNTVADDNYVNKTSTSTQTITGMIDNNTAEMRFTADRPNTLQSIGGSLATWRGGNIVFRQYANDADLLRTGAPVSRSRIGLKNYTDDFFIEVPRNTNRADNSEVFDTQTMLRYFVGDDSLFMYAGGSQALSLSGTAITARGGRVFTGDGSGLTNLNTTVDPATGTTLGTVYGVTQTEVAPDLGSTGLGYGVLAAITTGASNTAIGPRSGRKITTGRRNTGVGVGTLSNVISGNENVAIGYNAGLGIVLGTSNLAIGSAAMVMYTAQADGTEINNNVAIGRNVLGELTALAADGTTKVRTSYNTSIGDQSSPVFKAGDYNTNIGYGAGLTLTYGSQNTLIGLQAGDNLVEGDNNLAIGTLARFNNTADPVTTSNQIVIGNGAHNRLLIPGLGIDTGVATNKQIMMWNGSKFQFVDAEVALYGTKRLQGDTVNKNSIIESFVQDPNPEGKLSYAPYVVNDLAHLRTKGDLISYTATGFNISADTTFDRLFNGGGAYIPVVGSSFVTPTTDVVLEFDWTTPLLYAASVGIAFSGSFSPTYAKLEAFSQGAWVLIAENLNMRNTAETMLFGSVPGNQNIGTVGLRLTMRSDADTHTVRIAHAWGVDYNSPLATSMLVSREGGDVYGNLSVKGTLSAKNLSHGWTYTSAAAYQASVGEQVMVDTAVSACQITLPVTGMVGAEVRILDLANNAATNNITVSSAGQGPIAHAVGDLVVNTNGAGFALVFISNTIGWVLKDK